MDFLPTHHFTDSVEIQHGRLLTRRQGILNFRHIYPHYFV